MGRLKEEYIEKIYAGWLAKIIGIRLGAPVEGWSSEKIERVYGDLRDYPVDYQLFAADDDSNGPIFFLRALEDSGAGEGLKAQDVAEALLNYVPYEHGFFWWGGYGWSTEHTAYLNLEAGIPAPQSGSIQQNGKTVAEQIGGQIFIDTWGLAAPGNPDLAASLARQAASVTHGGDGIHGGIFIAVCISYAFVEKDIVRILQKALSYLPDCAYSRLVKEIMVYHRENPEDWRKCLKYIQDNHGYDKYPGNCHILPNTAVMILALLYGKGDFNETITICNLCGWDTDCNVGNVAVIMGIRGGLDVIEQRWRRPIGDFLACSSVIGSLNIQDIPYGALYIAQQAWNLAGEELPMPYRELARQRIHSCHFEFPGSTHGMKARIGREEARPGETVLLNTDQAAYTGKRSLKVTGKAMAPGDSLYIHKKTYLTPNDFHDSRYDPAFSPLVYPGQTLVGSIYVPDQGAACMAGLYVRDARTGQIYTGEKVELTSGEWVRLSFAIPPMEGTVLDEAGFEVIQDPRLCRPGELTVLIDDFYWEKGADYTVEFAREQVEFWTPVHQEISQFTRYKGYFYLEDKRGNLSCTDMGAVFTGRYDWQDYSMEFNLEPVAGEDHFGAFRVQGAMRCYLAGFVGEGRFAVVKKCRDGLELLETADFSWEHGTSYAIHVQVQGNQITASVGDVVIDVQDTQDPYLQGCVGFAAACGSHVRFDYLKIKEMTE